MVDGFRLYLRYIGISLRAQLEYRASLFMKSTGHLLITSIEFFGIWALFARFGSLGPWTLAEVALIYGMADLIFALADALSRGLEEVSSLVRSGDFDRILLRPRSTLLQLLGREVGLKRVGRIVQAIVVIAWASHAAPIDWTAFRILIFVTAILGGICLFIGLIVLQATSTFWTIETLEVWNVATHGGAYAGQYPTPIYRPSVRRFFTVILPVACVTYLPAVAILGRPDPMGTSLTVQALAPLTGPTFLLLATQLWRVGLRRYASTGS